MDHRYFYRDADGRGNYTCGIARETAVRLLRFHGMNKFADADFLSSLDEYINNPSVTGFFIEQATLSWIGDHGLSISANISKPLTVIMFEKDYPDSINTECGVTLYCPLKFNLRAIDGIIIRFEAEVGKGKSKRKFKAAKRKSKDTAEVCGAAVEKSKDAAEQSKDAAEKSKDARRKCWMFPIQVTVAKSHSDSEGAFFNNWDAWERMIDLEKFDIEVQFIWITGKDSTTSEVEDRQRNLRSAPRLTNPKYTTRNLPLRLVSPDIWDRYQRAQKNSKWRAQQAREQARVLREVQGNKQEVARQGDSLGRGDEQEVVENGGSPGLDDEQGVAKQRGSLGPGDKQEVVLGDSHGPGTAAAGAKRSAGRGAGDGSEQKLKKPRVGGLNILRVRK